MALVTAVAPLTILHASPFPYRRVVEHALDRPMIPHVGQRVGVRHLAPPPRSAKLLNEILVNDGIRRDTFQHLAQDG
ncbi:MAG: hypothetical protein ACRD9R_14855 [Pyrinomonadaceae bacterium]